MGLQSSAYDRDATPAPVSIAAGTKILENDIVVTRNMLAGDSGLFRIYWSFTMPGDLDYEVILTKLGAADLTGSPLKVNGDNGFVLKSRGYYRFDVGVKPGDLINLSASQLIGAVNDLQIQQIQIGA